MAESTPKKKGVLILEPAADEAASSDKKKKKVYRKSLFVNIRQSMDYGSPADYHRQSSASDMFNRLMSSGYPIASREFTSRRSTIYQVPRFQNNFVLESSRPFRREEVQTMLNRFMEYFLSSYKHNPKRAKRMAENLAVELRNMLKGRAYERYRIVALATIGDKTSQDFHAGMRFVWDAEKDAYVNYAHEAPAYFIIVTVFGVYFE
ncbi:conserved hypothetical protein [Culex quinquefasciatus]|uniref:Dynein light chain n=2 Tax=Culex pipiens complex TaxID=518105 RepID=B0WE64_CULQU|nr:conserved hypothetical protein [Culex quinquefasciatus]|eukprot:XP_001846998.1 conserved hypothetical protein [Culex quinquefasciatus]